MKATARRNVTVTIANRNPTMPRPRLGALPMTAAERQARRRAKLRRLGDPRADAAWPTPAAALGGCRHSINGLAGRNTVPGSTVCRKASRDQRPRTTCKRSPSSISTSCSPSSRRAATAAIDALDLRGTARSTSRWALDERLPLDQHRPAMQLAFVSATEIAATLTPALWVTQRRDHDHRNR